MNEIKVETTYMGQVHLTLWIHRTYPKQVIPILNTAPDLIGPKPSPSKTVCVIRFSADPAFAFYFLFA